MFSTPFLRRILRLVGDLHSKPLPLFVDHSLDISVTAHGGILDAFLANAGRPRYYLPTGGVFTAFIFSSQLKPIFRCTSSSGEKDCEYFANLE